MKRNWILATAVAAALGCSGTAIAANDEQPPADTAGYEQGHASAEESLPAHPGATDNDASAAGVSADGDVEEGYASPQETVAPHVTTDAKDSTSDEVAESGEAKKASASPETVEVPASAADGYEPGHASAGQALPTTPGADANDSSSAGVSASGEIKQGNASAHATMESTTGAGTGPNALALMSAKDLVDKPVKTAEGKEVGAIDAIVTDKSTAAHGYAVIGFGGHLGIGEKQVLLDLEQLRLATDGSIQVPATNVSDFDTYPEYVEKNYTKYDGEIAAIL